MKVLFKNITFEEVPNSVNLCYSISWCTLRCKGCHSYELRNSNNWYELTLEEIKKDIESYKWLVKTIVFLWWEWDETILILYLKIFKENWFNTCLYTWRELNEISDDIKNQLTYIKVWPWKEELWGLQSVKTNQQFIELSTNKILNNLFLKK